MIRLLSTDFDGTLVDHDGSPAVAETLYETLAELRRCGVQWAVNTGRDLGYALEGLKEFNFPIEPDFILTNERDIYRSNGKGGWEDFGDWNRRCIEAHERLFAEEQELVGRIRQFIGQETRAEALYEKEQFVGIIGKSDDEVDRFVSFLHAERSSDSLFHYQRNTIFLRFCHADYSKGTALAELCRLTGVPHEETFAIGDHHNDLSMLDGTFARWAAAPANAIEEVKSAVRNAGGYVASRRASEGMLEALHHFFTEHGAPPKGYSFTALPFA